MNRARARLLTAAILAVAPWFGANINAAEVRLAIVAEDPRFSAESDFLTSQLSRSNNVALVERSELNRVLKEQSFSTSHGTDFVKLGEILGADGVMMLDSVEITGVENLSVRLAAVREGVVLDVAEYPTPISDKSEWSEIAARRFEPLFPKLAVLADDAVPLSLLNLRSSVKSRAGEALERELNMVLVRRLLRRKEVFLLERQKLPLLEEEKQFKGLKDAPFWTGSYLLEGTIDKYGYDRDVLTLTARLTPPGKSSPIEFEVSGPRSNSVLLVSQLASNVLCKIGDRGQGREWSVSEEASRYFEEARWAFRWGMNAEALAAADSAWALGMRDLDCAMIRVKAASALITLSESNSAQGTILRPPLKRSPNELETTPKTTNREPSDPKPITFALRALGAYQEYSQNLGPGEASYGLPWCAAGTVALGKASETLRFFHGFPESRSAAGNQLEELRSLARWVHGWTYASPPVQERYARQRAGDPTDWLDDRGHVLDILACTAESGCFWQEQPEDCLPLYGGLMKDPAFRRLNGRICYRSKENPRLIAWNASDEQRIPEVWRRFLAGLDASTNQFDRLEAQCFRVADGKLDAAKFMSQVFEDRGRLLTNDAERIAFESELGPFFDGIGGAIGEEYKRAKEALNGDVTFLRQKQFLEGHGLNNGLDFVRTFQSSPPFPQFYSKAQALEMEPLLAAYGSNLLTQTGGGTNAAPWEIANIITEVGRAQEAVFWVLHPECGRPDVLMTDPDGQVIPPLGKPCFIPKSIRDHNANMRTASQELAGNGGGRVAVPPGLGSNSMINPVQTAKARGPSQTNSIRVTRFLTIPLATLKPALPSVDGLGPEPSGLSVLGHRVLNGKLYLDLHYQIGSIYQAAAAILDPMSGEWDIIRYPDEDRPSSRLGVGPYEPDSGPSFEVFDNVLFVSRWRGQIERCKLASRSWDTLRIPLEKSARLFTVNDKLYAASDECIVELLDNGERTRILASCRRRPAASALDSFDSLADVMLFPGPNSSLRANVGNKVFSWDGRDWAQTWTHPTAQAPEIFSDGAIFRAGPYGYVSKLWLLPWSRTSGELCLEEQPTKTHPRHEPFSSGSSDAQPAAIPLWSQLSGESLVGLPVTAADSNLYFLISKYEAVSKNGDPFPVAVKGGRRQTDLVCLQRGDRDPLVIPMRFGPESSARRGTDPERDYLGLAQPDRSVSWPASGRLPRAPWMCFVGDFLVFGRASLRGVWIIPKSEIDAAVAAETAKPLVKHHPGNDENPGAKELKFPARDLKSSPADREWPPIQ